MILLTTMNKNSKKKEKNKNGEMSLTGHLKELRNRIIVVLVVLIVGMVVCFSFAEPIIGLLTDIGTRYGYNFVYLKPQELLMVYFSMSLLCGFLIALPLVAYEIYAFCSPGMKKKEKSFMGLAMIFGLMFFILGVFFAYKITMPFMLGFLIKFSEGSAVIASVSIQEYISFVLLVFVIFGVIFELPVVSVLLTGLGIVKPEWIVKARKPMIVVIFVIAALITPPDIISQVMVALPIILLYELSIYLSKFVYRLKRKKQDADLDDDDDDDE